MNNTPNRPAICIASRARPLAPRHWLRLATLALVLAGCGGSGGVDSGGTGSSFASGSITGFGSVVVGGVRFDDASASVTDVDGNTRSRDDLRLGMSTEVHGSALAIDATGGTTATAQTIAFGGEIVGRVDAIDTVNRRLTVIGQGVDVTASTVFDDASLAGGFTAIGVGNIVEVSALFDAATGRYTATRIERKASAATFRLRGVVVRLDTTARSFGIGGETISYAGFGGALPAGLANGSVVRVRLQAAKVGGAWPVAALDDGRARPRDDDTVRVEGRVDAFTDATHYRVNGSTVDASRAGAVSGLALGARVEVEGTARGGVLLATRVQLRTDSEVVTEGFELRGTIASADAANQRFVLRGVTVGYAAGTTEFRNGSATGLVAGASVEARGVLSADGTRLVATRITFK